MNTMLDRQRGPSSGRRFFLKRTGGVRFKIALCMVIMTLVVGSGKLFGQGVGISEVSITPDGSSILELRSIQRGLLIPRMTTANRLAIATPAQGLLVYDTDLKTFWYYDAGWKMVPASLMGGPNQLLGMNGAGSANEYKTLIGIANQINVTHGAGTITLSTPQDIHTGASPTFSGLTLTTTPLQVPSGGTGLSSGISGGIPYYSSNVSMASSALLTANGVVIGGGPGTAPSTIVPGTTNTVLRGFTGGAPSFGQIVNGDITNGTIDLTSKVTGTLPVLNGGTGYNNTYSNGQILIGNSAGTLTRNTITQTPNQVLVTNGDGTITLSLPQNIHTGAQPTFLGLTVSGLTPNAGVYTDAASKLTSAPPTTGIIGYWTRTGTILSPSNAGDAVTTTGNIYTTGTGAITSAGLLTGQLGATVSGGIISLNNNSNFATNINTGTSTGNVTIGNALSSFYLPKFSTPGILHNDNTGLITSSLVSLTTDVSGTLPVFNGGTGLTTFGGTNTVLYTSAPDILTSVSTSTAAGQFLQTTTTGGAPSWKTILDVANGGTGLNSITTNNLIYGGGTSPVNLLAPSGTNGSLLTESNTGAPQWSALNTLPATSGILQARNGGTGYDNTYSNGQLLIGNSTGTLTRNPLTGTLNQVNVFNGDGSITLSTPQDIHSGATPEFVSVKLSSLTANSGVYTDGSKILTSTPPVNGIIGYWDRTGTVLSPSNTGDAVTTSGNISTTGSGTITSAGLLTGQAGATVSGAPVNLNNNSNFATNINTGSSTGAVRIGGTANTVSLPGFLTAGVVHNDAAGTLSTSQIVNGDIANTTIDLTQKVTGILPVPNGGTGVNTLTNHGVVIGQGANPVAITATGTSGQVLQSRGNALDPSYSTAIYPTSTTVNQILYSDANNNITGLPTANFGVLVTDGAGVPQILSLLPNAVQDNITRLGIVTLGTWQGSIVGPQYGGTGVSNTNTITLGGNINTAGALTTGGSFSTGANDITLGTTGSTNVLLPVTGTLSTLAGNEALTNKTINGLTPTSQPNGFTLSGGTVPATLTVPSSATVSGNNSGDVSLLGQNYLSLGAGQVITANPVDLSGANATGILAAGRFPILSGDITTPGGSLTTTISNNAVTYGKIQNVSAFSRLLGSSDASNAVSEIILGTGLTMTGNTLTASGFGGTVTDFTSGNLAPLFTTSVATSTTTPALSFTLSNAPAWSIFGNLTGGAAPPAFFSPTSSQMASVVTDETGTGGQLVFSDSPALTTPDIGAATGTSLTATGAITGSQITSTIATGLAPFVVTSTTPVANLSIGGNAATATIAGNVSGTVAIANGGTGATDAANARTNLGLGNVENTALSTWAGSTNLTTLGTITAGTWNAGALTSSGAVTGTSIVLAGGLPTQFLKADGSVDINTYLTGNQSITFAPTAGDVTGSATGTTSLTPTLTISNNAVTYAKMQNVSTTSRLLGSSSTTTPIQEITIGSGLTISGNNLIATGSGGTVTDFTSGNLAPLFTTSVATSTTTPALSFTLSNAPAWSIFGNLTGGAAPPTFFSPTSAQMASAVTDETGTGGQLVFSNSPALTTPDIGAATGTTLTATGAITGSQITSTVATGLAPFVVTSTTPVANLSIGGNAATATTAGSAANFTGALAGDVTGTQAATVVSNVGGVTAANVASGVNLANAATNANTNNAIVRRDATGNFSATSITANLLGNATTATTAGTATNFSGALSGDVTGTQAATVVSNVGGVTAANVASGANLANAATNANTNNAIVRRDATGNFSATSITANLLGNATTATSAGTATNFSGALSGDVTGTQAATVVSNVGGVTAANVASGANLANAATNANTNNAIVRRDATGNFSATSITANLLGNATTATTAGSATNFTGALSGDVTGTQAATVVSNVGGVTAANVASGANLANAATNANTNNAIVRRDATGNFSATSITANLLGNATTATTSASFSGALSGDVTGTQGATVVSTVGGSSAVNVNAATVLANAATNLNTASTIVRRDATGNFTAGTITAALNGNATTATTATSFSGALVGDVTGTQGATVVSTVGGSSAANVNAATVLANAATNLNTASTIVRRDATGNFTAGTITAALNGNATTATTATSFSGALVGDVTGTQGATVVSTVGGSLAANVNAATVLANAATNLNTASTIVRRDATGNFTAGTITAALSGNATTATSLQNSRSIYGNNFNGTADLTQVIASTYGGTGNGFTKFTGPTTAEKTFTLPDASATILTSNTAVTIAQGGTGQTTRQAAINALAGSTTSGQYLRGDGANIAMSTIQAADVPILNQNTTGTAGNVTGIVAIANGGTGSSSQNFVDLTTNQTVAGAKTWSNLGTFSAGITSTGADVNLNAGSNFNTNINTGGSTGTVTIGGNGAQTISIGNGAAAKTVNLGSSNSTSQTTILSGSGGLFLNVGNNQSTNINTGLSTGAVTIGGNAAQGINIGTGAASKQVSLGSNNTTSTTTLLSGSGGLNLNVNNNQPTNINTGTSTGALTLGNALNTITIDGIISGTNPLVFDGATPNANRTTFAITDPTAVRTITFPDASGTVALVSGTSWNIGGNAPGGASVLGTTDNSAINIQSGTGAITVGADAFQKAITLGNTTGTSSLTLNSGSGAINIGNSIAKTITIGNTTGATAVNINAGTGASTFTTTGTGTLVIGGSASTGNLTFGSSTGTQTVNIGTGTGANSVNIATGGTGNVTIGNTTGTITMPDFTVAGILHNNVTGLISSSLVSLASDVTGTLPIANGGTNNSALGLTDGGVIYADGTMLQNTGAGNAGEVLTSNGAAAPTWNYTSLTNLEDYLNANRGLVANTYSAALASVNLTPGTWLITSETTVSYNPAATTYWNATVVLGTAANSAYTSGGASTRCSGATAAPITISLSKIITVAVNTTVSTYAAANVGATVVITPPNNPSTAGTATGIHAVRIQ